MSEEEGASQPRMMNVLNFFETIKNSPQGNSLYLKAQNPQPDGLNPVSFERHFNPDLANTSDYFKALKNMTDCVEKNATKDLSEKQMDKVCAK